MWTDNGYMTQMTLVKPLVVLSSVQPLKLNIPCTHTHTHTRTRTHTHMHTHTHTHMHTHAHTHIQAAVDNGLGSYNNVVEVTKKDFDAYYETWDISSSAKGHLTCPFCTLNFTRTHTCMHACAHTHTHAHMHAHTHTHTHACIHTHRLQSSWIVLSADASTQLNFGPPSPSPSAPAADNPEPGATISGVCVCVHACVCVCEPS